MMRVNAPVFLVLAVVITGTTSLAWTVPCYLFLNPGIWLGGVCALLPLTTWVITGPLASRCRV